MSIADIAWRIERKYHAPYDGRTMPHGGVACWRSLCVRGICQPA